MHKSSSEGQAERTVHDPDLLLQCRIRQEQPQKPPSQPHIPTFFFRGASPTESLQTVIVCIHELRDISIRKAGCQSIGTLSKEQIGGNIQAQPGKQALQADRGAIPGNCLD